MTDENLTVTDTITLTKKEVEEARKETMGADGISCFAFLNPQPAIYYSCRKKNPYCRLCKKLTEFATVHCPNTGKEER